MRKDSHPRTPVLVGAAQLGGPDLPFDPPRAPQTMMADAALQALENAAIGKNAYQHIDTITVMRTYSDSAPHYISPFGRVDNYPALVAQLIGASPAREFYPTVGGNSPQWAINRHANEIAAGEADMVLLVGAEMMLSERRAKKAGISADWSANIGHAPEVIGDPRAGVTPYDLRHGLGLPISCYPLFDNAIAHRDGKTSAQHQAAMGDLLAPLAAIATQNPLAIDQSGYNAAQIAAISAENRVVAWPYSKRMCAREAVDLAAAVVMMAAETADALGIAHDKRVYLRGSGEVNEKWYLADRRDYFSVPALGLAVEAALAQSQFSLDDIDLIDLYSCFPCAISLACEAIGLNPRDRRGVSLTGGLPFFGGPGNNYALHSVAEAITRLQSGLGASALINGNGWYLTKHAVGVYAKEPSDGPWQRADMAEYQSRVDALESPAVIEQADGQAVLETFCVTFNRAGPAMGILIGRMADSGARFIANTANGDKDILHALMTKNMIGEAFTVSPQGNRNLANFG